MLFFPRKKTLLAQGLFEGFTDHHSHILPGVDDGVKTIDESIAILSNYQALGIKEVWLTPHIAEFSPNTTAHLQHTFQQLQQTLSTLPSSRVSDLPIFRDSEVPRFRSSEFPKFRDSEFLSFRYSDLSLHLSAEYMLDSLFTERLESNDLLLHSLPDEEPQVLVETSYFNPPMQLWDILHDIMSRGIRPILAHPERYQYMSESDYERLHDMGILLQLNLPSLLGLYGRHVQKRARHLLQKNYITHLGTDLHTLTLIPHLKTKKIPPIHFP